MDARQHDDLIYTIVQALMDARYEAPKRRRSARGTKAMTKTWSRPGASPRRS
jgi:hypothetical protein